MEGFQLLLEMGEVVRFVLAFFATSAYSILIVNQYYSNGKIIQKIKDTKLNISEMRAMKTP